MKLFSGAALSLLLAAGCASSAQSTREPAQITLAPQLAIRLEDMTRLPSGLYLRDEIEGTGAIAERNATVTVDYTGWLADGRPFDTTTGGAPLKIDRLGRGQVIRGWDEGLLGMRAGGRRLLVVPSHLGYGSRGAANGAVPPDATLVFRIDLRTVTPR